MKKLKRKNLTAPQMQSRVAKSRKLKEAIGDIDQCAITIAIDNLQESGAIKMVGKIPVYKTGKPTYELDYYLPIYGLSS